MTHQSLWVILCHLPEKERRDRRDSRGDERERQERKRNRNESEETKEKKIPPLPLSATRIGLAQLEAEVILEGGLGEKVSLSWQTSPYLELREK